MDEISQGPERDFRLPPKPPRWVTAVAVAGLVAVAAVVAVNRIGGQHGASQHDASQHGASQSGASQSGAPSVSASATMFAVPAQPPPGQPILSPGQPILSPTTILQFTPITAAVPQQAAMGTELLACGSVVWSDQPGPHWQAGSLRVGRLWLVGGRDLGYVRLGRTAPPARAGRSAHVSRMVEILVHVDGGSPVVMRTAGTSNYFEFLNSPANAGDYQGLDGGRGYTFLPCPGNATVPPDTTGFYEVGFMIVPGHTASVEVWTSPSARPVWLTFTAPKGSR